jgi:hypothetical protein
LRVYSKPRQKHKTEKNNYKRFKKFSVHKIMFRYMRFLHYTTLDLVCKSKES